MKVEAFRALVRPLVDVVADRIAAVGAVDAELEQRLMLDFPPDSDFFTRIEAACHEAIAEGWMCYRGEPGRRAGRIVEPSTETRGLSIDIAELTDARGPHHSHPNGAVLMIMPRDPMARVDGRSRGWLVYAPGTDHRPTAQGGCALILYLLPGGRVARTACAGG